jgi:hypothetical protein
MVAEYAERQLKQRRQNAGGDADDLYAAYLSILRDAAAVAKDQLSPEQWARLQAQVARRDEHRKRLIIRSLLLGLDEELALTAGQLDQLAGSLASHWDPRWEAEDIFNVNHVPFPAIPDPVIVPFLTEMQKADWKKLEKGSGSRGQATRAMVALEVAAIAGEGAPAGDDLDADEAVGPAPKR